jgi:D-alanyl-D-alanine dipeptidase
MRISVFALLISLSLWPSASILASVVKAPPTEFETRLMQSGLIDVQRMDSTIRVELKYAGTKNFMATDVYGELRDCFLQHAAAEKLVQASRFLKEQHPDLSLLVVDGLRPRHVQRRMWKIVQGTAMQNYVANPRGGSMHNYGCAVDITLVDKSGNRLDMGTPVDHFGPLAQPRLEKTYFNNGQLTKEQIANRRILRDAMVAAGFQPLAIEWWHFNAFDKKIVRQRYTIIE